MTSLTDTKKLYDLRIKKIENMLGRKITLQLCYKLTWQGASHQIRYYKRKYKTL